MDDRKIVGLYLKRDEKAISETSSKYGKYLYCISFRIVSDEQDAEECVNDTYISIWNSIPPHRPANLSTFSGKIVRRISIDLIRKKNAQKRGGNEIFLALDELDECVSGSEDVPSEAEKHELKKLIDKFLSALSSDERQVFMLRYWYLSPVSEISEKTGFSESKIKSMLNRTRNKLRTLLEKEGF